MSEPTEKSRKGESNYFVQNRFNLEEILRLVDENPEPVSCSILPFRSFL